MIPFDLHCHSTFSDGLARLHRIEDRCRQAGIGIALTDHNEIRGSIALAERGRINLIPALEVGTAEGFEFLVYFPDPADLETFFREEIEPHLLDRFMVRSRVDTLRLLDATRHRPCFASLAHPFAFGRKSVRKHRRKSAPFVDEVIERVDALEVYNGGIPARHNRQADAFFADHDLKFTLGSDAHELNQIGRVSVEIAATEDGSDASRYYHGLAENDFGDINLGGRTRVLASLPIIALRHTAHFVTSGRHASRHRAAQIARLGRNPDPD